MQVILREILVSDIPFLKKMHLEAVFWRVGPNNVPNDLILESQMAPDWGTMDGDTAIIATVDDVPVGAAWFRFWKDSDHPMGYVDEETPVVGIAILQKYQKQGVGRKLMEGLINVASQQAVHQVSLNVSKDNYAIKLYVQQGFIEFADRGDAVTMIHRI